MGNVELVSNHPGFYDKLTIGAGAVISTNVTINLDALVSVGKNVSLVLMSLFTRVATVSDPARRGWVKSLPIR